jgi:CRISPR-associated protein Cas1
VLNRILDFSESPARLRVKLEQLVVERQDQPEVSMPLADLAVIVVAHPQVTYTQAVLAGLSAAGGVFVSCNRQNLPVGMMLPISAHFSQAESFAAPLRKRLWRQLIRAKIQAQAETLAQLHGTDGGLVRLVRHVRSGDPANVEARAARKYWSMLFADLSFRRHRENEDQNVLLNYGYAVLRAIVARAICAVGLHPSLGLHHHNKYNAYCLADDLMEPFRPTVDRSVAEYCRETKDFTGLTPAVKQTIISDLTGRYMINGEQRTLFDVAAALASSLADVFLEKAEKLLLPKW